MGILDDLTDAGNNICDDLKSAITEAINKAMNELIPTIQSHIDDAVSNTDITGGVETALNDWTAQLQQIISTQLEKYDNEIIKPLEEYILNVVNDLRNDLETSITWAIKGIQDNLNIDNIKQQMGTIMKKIEEKVKDFGKKLFQQIDNIEDFVKRITEPVINAIKIGLIIIAAIFIGGIILLWWAIKSGTAQQILEEGIKTTNKNIEAITKIVSEHPELLAGV